MPRLPSTDVHDLARSAERFATAYPGLAGAMGQATTDAPLERVREGLFYLGAACMDRVRELEAEGQRALADLVAPDLLRPFPSATIVELSSERAARRVPAGAEVTSRGVRPVRFSTTSEIRVGPWRVEQARLVRSERHELQFDLVATGAPSLAEAVGAARPRFFVDDPDGLGLVAHVLGHTSGAKLVPVGGPSIPLGPVMGYGTRASESLAPEPDGPYTGLSLLSEYFLLPEKFCFFGLGPLGKALPGRAARRATVILTFSEPLPGQLGIAPTGIRAHCVPASNLFGATAEPWVFEPGRTSAPVRIAGLPRDEGGLYAILAASAAPRDQADAPAVSLPPVRRFASAAPAPGFPYAFSTQIVPSPRVGDPDAVVALTAPRGRPPALVPHVVSLQVLATNRARPGHLRPGDLTEVGAGMPPGVRARNITPCSPYVPPPCGPELALQVAVRAAVPDGDPRYALQSRLLALAPRRGLDAAAIRACIARIQAIEALELRAVRDDGRSQRGYEARLRIDETPFDGLGDVALFVRVLCAALEAQASIGHFYRVRVTCSKSGAEIAWPPVVS